MAKFKLSNTLKADEAAYGSYFNQPGGAAPVEGVNPGALTGPYGNGLRNNTLYIPLPLTNFQIELPAMAKNNEDTYVESSITIDVDGVLETEFIKALEGTIDGLTVEPVPTDDNDGGEG